MSVQQTWNNSIRNIPQAGDVGWPDLTDFLVDLAGNAQTTNKQLIAARTSTIITTIVTATTDCYVGINYAGAAAVTLPAGVNGQLFIISDESNAAGTNNITITPNGANTINSAATLVLNSNNQRVMIVFRNGDWKILANSVAVPITATSVNTLSNKTLDNTTVMTIKDANLTIQDDVDITKQAKIQLSAITTGTTRTYTFPDATVTFVGDSSTQTLTNKTLDNTTILTVKDANFTFQDDVDPTKQAKFELSGLTTATTRTYTMPNATTSIVATDVTQILTNKDIDGGTATNSSRITIPKASKSTLDALTRKQGTVVFASDQNKAYVDNGSSLVAIGSGSSGLYSTIDFEDNSTGGIATYANAAASTPSTGTGGAPSSTFTVNSSSPLRGTYDGLWTKSANNRQGEGFSVGFTLSNADVSKTIQTIFDFKASANYVSGDMAFYVYDITNATLITPSITSLPSGTSSQFTLAWQATTSTSYRLIWHTATVSALAYTVEVDNITSTSIVRPLVAGISDWISYTPTFSAGWGAVTNITFQWKRVGDSMLIQGFGTAGTVAATIATMSLPAGFTIDSTKIKAGVSGTLLPTVGYGSRQSLSTANILAVLADTSTSTSLLYFSIYTSSSYSATTAQSLSTLITTGEYFSLQHILIPIAQWSSQITLASTAPAIEYQSNSSATDADDTTSFVAGASGSVGILRTTALTSTRKKRIQFSTPIQPTDRLQIEWLDTVNNTWSKDYSIDRTGVLYISASSSVNATTVVQYGASIVGVSTTQCDVVFGQYTAITNSTNLDWNRTSIPTGTKWRVAKYSSIGVSELAPATAISAGTVSASADNTAYTPSSYAGLGTPTSVSIFYSIIGKRMDIWGKLTTGTVTGATITVAIPTGYTINTSLLSGTYIKGQLGRAAAAPAFTTLIQSSDSANLYVGGNGGSAPTSVIAGTALGSTEVQEFFYSNIPIN